ncbi:unnamed protein product [Calicophoron daubneyi]|uniref:Serine/threonine-protein kinase PLK4 n=1 Tax=Calicophoron daubneyi TaxID=300641 RepID=A0AAV2TKQ2_CALDB
MIQSCSIGRDKRDFQIFELLGRGGFAQVYRAKSTITGQEVAIKMIDKTAMIQQGLANRVRREVEIHCRLKHPSILELYTCFEDANYVYLVLEMCHNGELQTYVKQNGPVTEDTARCYLKQLIDGILYLHSHNILHRDLTLSNLLLTKDMKIKIADFGLATKIEPGEEHTTMCGTPNYISPEVASHGQQTLETDVWSLGCMFYTLIIGHPPFDTREVRSTLNRVLAVDYELPPSVSPEAAHLIGCLLKRQPNERIKLQSILHHPFMQKKSLKQHSMGISNDSGIDSLTKTPSCILRHNVSTSNAHDTGIGSCPTFRSISPTSNHSHPEARCCSNFDSQFNSTSNMRVETLDSATRPQHPEQQHMMEISGDSGSNQVHSNPSRQPVPLPRPIPYTQARGPSSTSCFAACSPVVPGSVLQRNCNSELFHPASVKDGTQLTGRSVRGEKLSPLNSQRLRPMRTHTRLAIVNILDDSSVCLEFLKKESSPLHASNATGMKKSQTWVTEVMGISSTGDSIVIYQPNGGRGVPVNLPAPGQGDAEFDAGRPPAAQPGDAVNFYQLQDLPRRYVKKYQFGSKFVQMVRAHTPKLTVYTEQAKCMLMENAPLADFVAEFYSKGTRVTITNGESVRITQTPNPTGKGGDLIADNLILNSPESLSTLGDSERHLLDYTRKQWNWCRHVEDLLSHLSSPEVDRSYSVFPVVIGRRPKSSSISHSSSPPSQLKLQLYDNLPSPIVESPLLLELVGSCLRPFDESLPKRDRVDERRPVFVPNVGWAQQSSDRELQVNYNDGAQLTLLYDNAQVQSIGFTPPPSMNNMDPHPQHFTSTDHLPGNILQRLESVPIVIQRLLIGTNSDSSTVVR